ncbi:MAG: sulfite oxidase heme-binding subunit YedZ [Vicinamibacterales bacterium]
MTPTQLVRRVIKPLLFLAGLGPLTWLTYHGFWGDLGVNPVETVTNTTGIWTLRLIALSLAITPLRWLTKWNPVILLRRPIGLFAFFYGVLHFMTYFVLDHSLMFDGLWEDIVERPYITVGFTAFVLLIPLAITSTQGWIRRLGGRRWNLLHKLVYISACLGVLHYWWKVKLDTTAPMFYGLIVAALLGIRVWRWWMGRQPSTVSRRTVPVSET